MTQILPSVVSAPSWLAAIAFGNVLLSVQKRYQNSVNLSQIQLNPTLRALETNLVLHLDVDQRAKY